MTASIATASLGEFIGTLVLVLLGDGVCAAVNLRQSKAQNAGWVAIALGWGLAVVFGIYTSSFLGPAHLNPAVTLAFAVIGQCSWAAVVPYIVAQMVGGFCGALLVWLNYRDHFDATADSGLILGTFATGPAIRNLPRNFFNEALGTAVLLFGLLALTKGQFAAGVSPLVVGGLIVAIGFSLGGTTGYAINPARDIAPRLVHQLVPISHKGSSDWAYSIVPGIAPLVGGIIGAGLYRMLP